MCAGRAVVTKQEEDEEERGEGGGLKKGILVFEKWEGGGF